jgi:hypothetical protein
MISAYESARDAAAIALFIGAVYFIAVLIGSPL